VHFFAKLDKALQLQLCRYLQLHKANADDIVIAEGKGPDPGQSIKPRVQLSVRETAGSFRLCF
jgi:hypothetical protein